MGGSLSALRPPSQIVDVMSIYHPFPLRLDSLNKGAPVQYDACLQLGEFPSKRYKGNTAVVLFPLKVKRNPGPKGKFMDGIASKIPTILGQQPDPINGYPDVPAHTGADWSIEDILFMKNKEGQTVSRAFYAWFNKTPFPVGVVVMAEPVYISQSNMDAIKRLPITPPSDVIHEIGTPILYKPGPLFDEEGNPQPCPATKADMAKKAMDSIVQPPVPTKKSGIDLDLFFQIVLGTLGTLVVILGVWMGIKLAMGPGSTVMKTIGDTLGKSLAGGYEALKKAKLPVMPAIPPIPAIPQSVKDSVNKTRRNLGTRLGLGPTGKFGTKRQANIFPDLKPSDDLKMTTNPLFNKDRTLRNSKRGTISSIANLPAANIPEPAPAPAPAAASVPTLENIVDDMPSGVTVNPVVARRRSARNTRKSSVNSIRGLPEVVNAPAPKDTPAEIANIPAPKDTPAEISNLPTPQVNPALAEIEELEQSDKRLSQAKSNALKKVSVAKQLHNVLNPVSPPTIPNQRNKTLRNSALKVISAKQAEKKLGQVQAKREIDSWLDDSPAPASASVPTAVSASPPSEDALVPKSEFKTWDRRRQSEYIQKLAKKYNKRLVSGYINVMTQTIGSKPWNPSTKIDSVSRLAKGGRKRRNRRKTGHQLRNRKKTGRKI